MGLYEAHLYHAVPIPTASGSKSKPCRLYHGLNRLFTMTRETPIYFGPFSTPITRSVATTFCEQRGLIWLIQSSYANLLKLCVGINMDWISGFKHEREVLLYNQCLAIQETETFDDDPQIMINHFLYSLKARRSPIIKANAFYNRLGVRFEEEGAPFISSHKLLFEETECGDLKRKLTVIDRLVTELNIVSPPLLIPTLRRERGNKPYLEYLVEDLGATQLIQHYRVMTSKFTVHSSNLLDRSWLRFAKNTKLDEKCGVDDDDNSCFEETEYRINGVSVPSTISFFEAAARKITVKNTKLFGDRFVALQNYEETFVGKEVPNDFVDALKVDRYGFVFLDHIPSAVYPFRVGQEVQWRDGTKCEITGMADDRICVKLGGDDMVSFRWIERAEIPMEIDRTFCPQQGLSKYVFAVTEGKGDHSRDLSSGEQI